MLVKLIDRLDEAIGAGASIASLRTQLDTIRQQAEALEAEIDALKLQLEELKSKAQTKALTPYENELDETAFKMLERFFNGDSTIERMAEVLGIEQGKAKHYRAILKNLGFIKQTAPGFKGIGASGDYIDTSGMYGITDKGQEYVSRRRAR